MADVIAVRVARKTREASDICALRLERVDGGALPPFTAGAHLDVHLPGGLVRQYSLLSPPGETQFYEIAILRELESRGGSRAIHEAVEEGGSLTIGVPRNFFPLERQGHSLLLAGGIGITPILCMAQALHAEGRALDLHYCARSPARAAFLDRLAQSGFADRVALHFDDGPQDQRLDLAGILAAQPADSHLYICGPSGFIAAVKSAAEGAGWAPARIHVEYFKADQVDPSENQPFEIEVASTGETFDVPADRSALDILAEAGFDIPSSCEEGICGSCITGVVSGELVHRDEILSEAEHASGTLFTPCCSRARGRLVVDL